MGWCSGTRIFDTFCAVFFDPKTTSAHEILVKIISELEMMDWDCQQDSSYWDTPAVQKAMKEIHPDWFKEDNQ